jgi:deoxyribose-phosphate aldolase
MKTTDLEFLSITDYTLLDEQVSVEILESFCESAEKYGVKSVCVAPSSVEYVVEKLEQSTVLLCSVVSFPSGLDRLEEKSNQIKRLIQQGVDEIDMVMNYQQFKLDNVALIQKELSLLVQRCADAMNVSGKKVVSKVIVESGELSLDQVKHVTELCISAGVDFIKTSTGKVPVGAELNKVEMMRRTILNHQSILKIKASGGIRTLEQIQALTPFVNRFGIGCQTVDALICDENNSTEGY